MYILPFCWCCSLQFKVCRCIYYYSAGGLGFSSQLTAPVLHPAMDQGFTCEACNRQQPPSAFPHNCNGVRHYLCNTCRPLQQRRQRPQQQRSPPNFNLILSQPSRRLFPPAATWTRTVGLRGLVLLRGRGASYLFSGPSRVLSRVLSRVPSCVL